MQQPTPAQSLCDLSMATLPQLMHMQSAFLVHENFRTIDFGPSTERLDDSVSLYTFCPMDTTASPYNDAVAEVNHLQQESFVSTRVSTTTGVVG